MRMFESVTEDADRGTLKPPQTDSLPVPSTGRNPSSTIVK
jgi:hypothetical protein